MKITLVIFFLSSALCSLAQVRAQQSINSGWQFILNDQPGKSSVNNVKWQKVNLPHTWNASDIIDDTLGFHQGIGWYKKEIFIPEEYRNRHLELFFEGACNRTTVFVNDVEAGQHSGGFTGFKINLDGKVGYGVNNTILVKVDNGKYLQDSIPPFSGDFSLMGGIYRDLWLTATNKFHFNHAFGSDGIFFSTPAVSERTASFLIRASMTNNSMPASGSVAYQLIFNRKTIKSGSRKFSNAKEPMIVLAGELPQPNLWSPEHPQLYELIVQLKDSKGTLLDEIQQHVGFKWVSINASNEFLLNGKPYKLKGASRHQDFKQLGNALTDAMHERDIKLMKDMGCNFIRIAHYPQDPAIYDACDRLGLLAWSEIPVVDRFVNNAVFASATKQMMQEMIWQNYNHPCVGIWGYHNEVRNLEPATIANAKALNSLAKTLDSSRLTAMAFESNIDAAYFKSNPLLKDILNIADINGYNVYQGWYRGKHENISAFLDTLYAYNPAKPIFLSEYGAGSVTNLHSYQPTLFDFSEEYQTAFHESYVKAGNTKPWLAGFAIWNFIDFQRDGREDVVPNINKKGMVTTDRQPKDAFYFYKSQWSNEPFVYIAGKHWEQRVAVTAGTATINIPIVVYSNQKELQLLQDGKPLSSITSSDGKFQWNVNVKEGTNHFYCQAAGAAQSDVLDIHYDFIDSTSFTKNDNWHTLNFNTGQSRTFFTDTKSQEQWMPDKAYYPGSWGYTGGRTWNTWPSAAWDGIREGIHKPIALTENEPLFQTFVEGLSAWKADVTAGKYRITLLLSEPFTPNQRNNEERIFNIKLNGVLWMQGINLEKDYGLQTAVILDKIVDLKEKEFINIEFEAVNGKTILNGVKLERL